MKDQLGLVGENSEGINRHLVERRMVPEKSQRAAGDAPAALLAQGKLYRINLFRLLVHGNLGFLKVNSLT